MGCWVVSGLLNCVYSLIYSVEHEDGGGGTGRGTQVTRSRQDTLQTQFIVYVFTGVYLLNFVFMYIWGGGQKYEVLVGREKNMMIYKENEQI